VINLNIIKKLIDNKFFRSVILIAGGTAFGQAIIIISSPIISRLYSPEEYGILTTFTAVLGMLAVVGSLKYEWGIAIADDDDKAINVTALSFLVLFVVVGLLALILYGYGEEILVIMDGENLYKYRLFIPIGVLFIGIYNILTQWALRKKNFKALSKTKVSQSIVQSLIHILFGFFNMGPIALIIGRILGQSAGTITLAIPFLDKDRKLIKKINRKDIFWSAKRYIKFPLISSISQFLNTASIQLPVLFISSQYGNKAIGFYGLANSIINLPTTLIGNAVGDVFYGEAASVGNQDPLRLKQLSIEILKKLMIIGLVPLIIIVLFGPYLFLFVFGVEWKEAGIYARIISFLAYARLIFIPVSRIYSIFERQKEAFLIDALRVILVIIVFTITNYLNLNLLYAVSLYSFSISLVYLITFLVLQKIINYEINKVS